MSPLVVGVAPGAWLIAVGGCVGVGGCVVPGARLTTVGGGVAACAAELLLAGGVVGGLLFILLFLISKRLGRLRSLLVDVKLFTLTSLLVSGSFGDGGFLAAQCFPNRRYVVEC